MRIAVLASGRGSNFVAIHDAIESGKIAAEIAVIISNKPEATVIEAARERGVEVEVVDSRRLAREEFDRRVVDIMIARKVELVLLAGFMMIVGKPLLDEFPLKIMNVHPSLLPSFKGLNAQRQALEYGAKVSGCTVHFVDKGVDTGPIILQSAVPIHDNDTVESLSERILFEEHSIYPEAVKLFVEGRFRIDGRRVLIER